MIDHLYLILAELSDPWFLLIFSMGVVWVVVVCATLYTERRASKPVGATADPDFFNKITEYHNEL